MCEEPTTRLDEFEEIVGEALQNVAETVRNSLADRLDRCLVRLNALEAELDLIIEENRSI